MKKEDAKELYLTAVKLSEQHRRTISTYTGFAVTINVGIWSYFLKAYIDSLGAINSQCSIKEYVNSITMTGQPLYLGIAAAISSIVIGAWRFHNRQVDNDYFGFYTDLLRYELMAHVPVYNGELGGLIRTRHRLRCLFWGNNSGLSIERKLKVINKLIINKQMGWDGCLKLEWFIFALIISMLILILILFGLYPFPSGFLEILLAVLCILGILLGLFIVCYEIYHFHREPDDACIEDAIKEV